MRAEVHVVTRLHAGIAPAVLWDRNKWLLACSFTVTTQLSSAGKWGHKRARGDGTINIFRAYQHSSSVGLYSSTKWHYAKNELGSSPLHKQGQKTRLWSSVGNCSLTYETSGHFPCWKEAHGQGEHRLQTPPLSAPFCKAVRPISSVNVCNDGAPNIKWAHVQIMILALKASITFRGGNIATWLCMIRLTWSDSNRTRRDGFKWRGENLG